MDTAEKIEDIIFEPDMKDGFVICRECGKYFKLISPSHLRTHDMKMSEYIEKYPDAPIQHKSVGKKQTQTRKIKAIQEQKKTEEKTLPIRPDVFVDSKGVKRLIGSNKILTGSDALTTRAINELPLDAIDFKEYAKTYGEKLFIWLTSVIEYDQKKVRHKKPLYTTADKFKAADLLHKSMPKPATERVVDTTIKKLTVSIGGKLPDDFEPEDF